MKGFVFTFRNNQKPIPLPDLRQHGNDFKKLASRYGLQAVLGVMFLLGLIIGAVSGRGFGEETFEKLDLLFVTNIDARMNMNIFSIFISCFVSYFLFIFCVFLSGFSVWGFLTVPLVSALKGFTVGLSSAFVFIQYGLSGIGFYILVVLPGTVLFLFALIRYASCGFRMSYRFLRLSMFGYDREPDMRSHIKTFIKKTIFALLSVCGCAVVDMVLWVLFAGKFSF